MPLKTHSAVRGQVGRLCDRFVRATGQCGGFQGSEKLRGDPDGARAVFTNAAGIRGGKRSEKQNYQ
jgi:hypothetical protein